MKNYMLMYNFVFFWFSEWIKPFPKLTIFVFLKIQLNLSSNHISVRYWVPVTFNWIQQLLTGYWKIMYFIVIKLYVPVFILLCYPLESSFSARGIPTCIAWCAQNCVNLVDNLTMFTSYILPFLCNPVLQEHLSRCEPLIQFEHVSWTSCNSLVDFCTIPTFDEIIIFVVARCLCIGFSTFIILINFGAFS